MMIWLLIILACLSVATALILCWLIVRLRAENSSLRKFNKCIEAELEEYKRKLENSIDLEEYAKLREEVIASHKDSLLPASKKWSRHPRTAKDITSRRNHLIKIAELIETPQDVFLQYNLEDENVFVSMADWNERRPESEARRNAHDKHFDEFGPHLDAIIERKDATRKAQRELMNILKEYALNTGDYSWIDKLSSSLS